MTDTVSDGPELSPHLPPTTSSEKTFMQILARPGWIQSDPLQTTVDILILSIPCLTPSGGTQWLPVLLTQLNWSNPGKTRHKLRSSRAPPWQSVSYKLVLLRCFRKNNKNQVIASLFEFSRLFQYEKSPWEPFSVRWRENGSFGEPTEGGEVPGRGSRQKIRRG